jgi:hypothetical protein
MDSQNDQQNSDQYGQPANQTTTQSGDQGPAGGIDGQAVDRIDQAIDQLAGHVPGGAGMAQKAKDAVPGALDSLEKTAEGRLGGLFGNKTK